MKTEDFNKTIEELKKEINENRRLIASYDNKSSIAKSRLLEEKTIKTLIISFIPYVVINLLLIKLATISSFASILSAIPAHIIGPIVLGGSIGIGSITRRIIDWKFKMKEKFQSFSNAKTQKEICKEEMKYSIDLEKTKNRNKTIEETINSLSTYQSTMNSLFNKYGINKNNHQNTETDNKVLKFLSIILEEEMSEEEIKEYINDLSNTLEENYTELDILSTEAALHKKSWKARTKGFVLTNVVFFSLVGGMFSLILSVFPIVIIEALMNLSTTHLLFSSVAYMLVGILCGGGYLVKRRNDDINTFNHFNKDLNENALPGVLDDHIFEELIIKRRIEDKIKEISILRGELEKEKRILESFNNKENEKELNTSVTKEKTNLETKEENIALPMINEIPDSQIEEEGPSLKLKRN